ncbi:MAG: efflux RND transporter periplasmic adaptor subunit [Myxococcota bacterium]|nr:efflux RND transporter periplasmic adaptor subunit [Myxococcota bacterium]
MRPSAKVWLPIAILGVGALGVALLVFTRPTVEPRPPRVVEPLVRVRTVAPQRVQYAVAANGTVVPRTQSDLVPQVSGEVLWVSPSLVSGGFFYPGDPLLRIDRSDYEVALESSRAAVARAESEFARAQTERDRQRRLAKRSVASQAAIDDANNAFRVAQAQLREARSALERAERDLDRTEIRAPFEGRVREESVDVGQFVSRGTPVAKIYAVDTAEVRLPVPDRQLSYLDLHLGRRQRPAAAESGEPATNGARPGPEVLLRADFAGREQTWRGRIVRTEGEIDPRSRMVNVIASVEDPYGADPPLAVGLFVSAEILGREVEGAFVLPQTALREEDGRQQVLVVDDESRIRFRDVEVLRVERGQVVVGSGLAPGERVSVSPLPAAVEGMRVRVAGESEPRLAEAPK